MTFIRNAWTLAFPLSAIIVAATLLYIAGYTHAAFVVSNFGTLLTIFGNVIYIILFDPMHRWPEASPWQRFVRLITFQR